MPADDSSSSSVRHTDPDEQPWAYWFALAAGIFCIGVALADVLVSETNDGTLTTFGVAMGISLLCIGSSRLIPARRETLRKALSVASVVFAVLGLVAVVFFN